MKQDKSKLLPFIREDVYGVNPSSIQIIGWEIHKFNIQKEWKYSQGENIKIGVIDTGCDLDHIDIKNNILTGINLVDPRKDPYDDNGHGTHVCGSIAAENNGLGMVGVSPKSKIVPIKALDGSGSGNNKVIAQGIIFAADNNCDFITMSLGSSSNSTDIYNAILYAVKRGCIIFCAAGNSGESSPIMYPARHKEVIAIGSVLKNNPEVALESIRQRLLQESDMYVQEFGAIPESLANARISISKLQKQLREERRAFEESQKNKVEPQTPLQFFQNRQDNPFNIPSGPPTTNRPTGTSRVSNNNDTQFVSDVSIQRFQEGANAFSKSLNDAPLQNLSDSLSSFNSASQALINSLQSFEAKFSEGMKGTIAHDASVQVSFSDSLAVDLPKNNNTISMVDMVVNAIRPLIATEITRGLKREV